MAKKKEDNLNLEHQSETGLYFKDEAHKQCTDFILNGTGTPSAGGLLSPGQEIYQKINHHC